jgi:serine/threonine protein kinase
MLTPGTRIGPYEILSGLGAGGMGEVYRARDRKLHRDVAIKVLLAAVAGDPDRLARFSREAQVLASLNHPNIAAIYGFEDSSGVPALALELVEGPTLAERIEGQKGQGRGLPLAAALSIARQIAEALEAAHEQGIIHRDLKPANIKVRPDGTVKVLDFGLAKAMDATASPNATAVSSPTISLHATQAGIILGTAAYMSPEQVAGQLVDKRSDVWAFGVVLFEMLSGRQLFAGETVSHVLAAVLTTEPDWTTLPASTPAPIRTLLRRCLDKDRKRRIHDAGDIRLEIEDALALPAESLPSAATTSSPFQGSRLGWLIAAGALCGALALAIPAVRHLRESASVSLNETRTDIVTPATATNDLLSFALSPDGRQIVFAASGDGAVRLWLRSLNATTSRPLAGTDGAMFPFWSPDSRSVGFFADDQLKVLDLGGGMPRTVASGVDGRGATWNRDGVILFATGRNMPLSRVTASGGTLAAVTTLDGQISHRFPVFLPDGRHFLFYAQGKSEKSGIYLGSLDSGTPLRLTLADAGGMYLPSSLGVADSDRTTGWLLSVQSGALVAQRLDLGRQTLENDRFVVADAVFVDGNGGYNFAGVSASASGLVAYRHAREMTHQLTWVDRSGKVLGTVGPPDTASLHTLHSPRLSPDGRRIAVSRTVQGNENIWLLDGPRMSRLTFNEGHDRGPVWSPDGTQVLYDSDVSGVRNLYVTSAAGGDKQTLLVESPIAKQASDWSMDGRSILYHGADPRTTGLWVRPMNGPPVPLTMLSTTFDERAGKFSPDGRWVAYQSNESGRPEIYVRPFTLPAQAASGAPSVARWQISTAGGITPTWRADGRELYYIAPDGAMLAASITTSGGNLDAGTPVKLFSTPLGRDEGQFDVARDGRFLINIVLDDSSPTPITLIQNWQPVGKR